MRRPSFFLLIYIRVPESRFRLAIAFPVFVVTDVLDSLASLVRVADLIVPKALRRLDAEIIERFEWGGGIGSVLSMASGLWRELMWYGSWTFIDISTEDGVRVMLKFM